MRENQTGNSLERCGVAALAVLLLAPVNALGLWCLATLVTGGETDTLALAVMALAVTAGTVISHLLMPTRKRAWSIGLGTALGIGLGCGVGADGPSRLALCLALALVAALHGILFPLLLARLPRDMDGMAKTHRFKAVVLTLVSLMAVLQTTRLCAFMGDATQMESSMVPQLVFLKNHSCFSSYAEAVRLAQSGEPNLYDQRLWPDELALSKKREVMLNDSGPYAPFFLDNYMYPPQFLLLPATVMALSPDFLVQRALWFVFCALFLLVGFWVVAVWAGTAGKRHALWLIPLVWSAMVTLVTLQVGNVHQVVMVMAVLAMVAFDRKQPVLGGGLLAFAILSKISPGILVILLLVQRRWRDLGWTLGFGLAFTLVTVVVYGTQPIDSFLTYQLPRIASGESMRWFSSLETNVMVNSGPFGIPFKLAALGVPIQDPWSVARVVNMAYTLLIVVVTVRLARQPRTPQQSLYLWVSLLMLSSLQSPFSPGYVVMPVLWLLTLLAPEVRSGKAQWMWVLVWIVLAFPVPLPDGVNMVVSLLQQLLVMGVIAFALLRKGAPAAPAPAWT